MLGLEPKLRKVGANPPSSISVRGRRAFETGVVFLFLCAGVCAGLLAQVDSAPQGIPREVRPADVGSQGSSLATAPRGLTVTVVDFRGPVSGATIRLTHGKKTLVGYTSENGVVLLDVRKQGRWQVEVLNEGYLPSKGVVPWPLVSSLEIELRSVGEGTPAFVEAPSDTEVRLWLQKGEALLAEGKYAEARAELSKSLGFLDLAGQAEVRGTVARSYWLEGDRRKGLEELEAAIRLDPQAAGARQVFSALMEAVGRTAEVEARLAQLAEETPKSIAPRAERPSTRRAMAVANPKAALAHAVGAQEVRFLNAHPLGEMKTVLQRLGYPEKNRAAAQPVDLSRESFDVFVPDNYARRDENETWGLFVWISPMERGGVRGEEIRRLLAERRLIWVGANNSGNPRSYWQRVALALHAAENARRLWDIAEDRVFIGGYSGGGRTASMTAWLWPEVFRGGVFWMGTDFFEPVSVPYAPGQSWPARFDKPSKGQLRLVRKRSRFAFVTGDLDFNRSETLATHRKVVELGFQHMTYLQIPGADHYSGLRVEALGQALSAIEP